MFHIFFFICIFMDFYNRFFKFQRLNYKNLSKIYFLDQSKRLIKSSHLSGQFFISDCQVPKQQCREIREDLDLQNIVPAINPTVTHDITMTSLHFFARAIRQSHPRFIINLPKKIYDGHHNKTIFFSYVHVLGRIAATRTTKCIWFGVLNMAVDVFLGTRKAATEPLTIIKSPSVWKP